MFLPGKSAWTEKPGGVAKSRTRLSDSAQHTHTLIYFVKITILSKHKVSGILWTLCPFITLRCSQDFRMYHREMDKHNQISVALPLGKKVSPDVFSDA